VGIHEALPRHDSQAHDAIWAMSTAIVQTAPRSAPKSDKHRHLEPLADSMREYRIRAMESSLLSFEIGLPKTPFSGNNCSGGRRYCHSPTCRH
jgi:hypothetical protein